MNINEKIEKLKEEVEWFYGEKFDLALASKKYEVAVELAKEIEKDLNELKNEITRIDKDFTKE